MPLSGSRIFFLTKFELGKLIVNLKMSLSCGRRKGGRLSTGNRVDIVVVGAHLTGMPLNRELVELGGQLVGVCRTANDYRLFAPPDSSPPKPGLLRNRPLLGSLPNGDHLTRS
jgi:hypothetical protein